MMQEEPLLTSEQIVEHMKKRGITFQIITEQEAQTFLEKKNYYKKLASYRNNYETYESEDGEKKFKDLEFAYLQELSYIDMELRYFVFQMCLDIEHYLKVCLLYMIENNWDEEEDGYRIVSDFVDHLRKERQRDILGEIRRRNNDGNRYCKNLIQKYLGNEQELKEEVPIWTFVELIPFGDFVNLCEYYDEKYGTEVCDKKLLYAVRDIRNACAHSNCLINILTDDSTYVDDAVKKRLDEIDAIKDYPKWIKMKNYFIYDFVCLLFAYYEIVTDIDKKKQLFLRLQEFFEGRMLEHRDWFEGNETIAGSYEFVKAVFDYLHDSVRVER